MPGNENGVESMHGAVSTCHGLPFPLQGGLGVDSARPYRALFCALSPLSFFSVTSQYFVTEQLGMYPEDFEVCINHRESVRYSQIGPVASHFQHMAPIDQYSTTRHSALLAGTKNVRK